MLSPSWAYIAYAGLILGPCWAYVGPMLAYVGPICLSMLSHLGSYVGVMFRPFIYVETILRCQFFPSRAPPRAQNHVKTDVFEHRQDKIRAHRRARNTVKKKMCLFLNTASRKHRKLRRLQSTGTGMGVVRRSVGGTGGQHL